MLEHIQSAHGNLLAIRAVGRITDTDYKTVLIPEIELRIKEDGKVRFVYVLGPEFEGYGAKAAMDDVLLGLHHWRDFERLAIVTDRDWIANGMRIFMPLMPARTRVFGMDEMQEALDWAAA